MLPDIFSILAQLTTFFPTYAEIPGGAAVTAMDPGLIAEHVDYSMSVMPTLLPFSPPCCLNTCTF